MLPMLIPTAIGMGLGALKEQRQADALESFNKGQAEMTKYSPWTGVRGEIKQNTHDPMMGAMQGGMSGAMFGQQFMGDGDAEDTLNTMSKPENTMMAYEGSNSLGGQDYAKQLGSSFGSKQASPWTEIGKTKTLYSFNK